MAFCYSTPGTIPGVEEGVWGPAELQTVVLAHTHREGHHTKACVGLEATVAEISYLQYALIRVKL